MPHKDPEAARAYHRNRYATRPDVRDKKKRDATINKRKRYAASAIERLRHVAYNLKYNYGLSLEDYLAMMRQQGGLCAICRAEPKDNRRLNVDHCHASGAVRGLLCDSCNHGLGKFRDSPDALRIAAAYLEAHS